MRFALILLCSFVSPAFAGGSLTPKLGIYKLSGSSTPKMEKVYKGKVIIDKAGDNYRLTWLVAGAQTQRGLGLLENSVLSVTYVDMSGRDFGVVSYKIVNSKKLEGRWAPILATGSYGLENLEYEGPVPVVPKTEKNKPGEGEINL